MRAPNTPSAMPPSTPNIQGQLEAGAGTGALGAGARLESGTGIESSSTDELARGASLSESAEGCA
ncbi:hypothetical protein [Hymenobacter sp. B1770]|uniref:hypothetical protein n=1 Tax=Hymenobacter sp. B1770 TaxID=1718788 RepID=UPI003CF7FE63